MTGATAAIHPAAHEDSGSTLVKRSGAVVEQSAGPLLVIPISTGAPVLSSAINGPPLSPKQVEAENDGESSAHSLESS